MNILSGGYRLHAFAASQWVGLVRKCAGMLPNRTPPDELITLLEQFVIERENMEYEGLSDDVPEYGELEPFKKEWPSCIRFCVVRRNSASSTWVTGALMKVC